MPVQLTAIRSASDGTIHASVAIPADTAVGAHELIFAGTTSGQSATVPITVTSGDTTEGSTNGSTTTVSPGATSSGSLPFTGASGWPLLFGLLALLGGTVTSVSEFSARRRKRTRK
jgi:hypothetical protein